MNFRDQGIIISKKLLKERSYIITVFTKQHGIYSGVLKQYNKKSGDSLTEGNFIDFFWNARLHEHLGSAKAELIKSYNSYILMNKTKLYAFNSIVSLLRIAFCEREPHNNLFPTLLDFISALKQDFSFARYIQLELTILAESGYRLQLEKCVVTNSTDDLQYVSPKSAQSVSKQAGMPYADKLLKLPSFLISNKGNLNYHAEINNTEKNDAFSLASYFLQRYLFPNKPQPAARVRFINHINEIL